MLSPAPCDCMKAARVLTEGHVPRSKTFLSEISLFSIGAPDAGIPNILISMRKVTNTDARRTSPSAKELVEDRILRVC